MKILYICDVCETVYSMVETNEQEGLIEVSGLCEACSIDMGFTETGSLLVRNFYYH